MKTATFIQDETEFDSLVKNESVVVVDCTATWCGPCKIVAPLMDQLAEEYGDRIKVRKLDLDANRAVAKRFAVNSIPAVMFFKQGERIQTLIGVKPYQTFSDAVSQLL
ncbi:MAG: thioredoxin [Leptolyngbyaceae cyanobacterium]